MAENSYEGEMSSMNKIDFVVTWVDGNDPEWLAEKEQYMPKTVDDSNSVNRYRDWGLMKYWFRGVEKFAPWVNKVYFVTWGHYPEWLNLNHTKLVLVKHTDYIPHEYLPTFNSNVIELNLHRLLELSEQFVIFNDDMFLTDYVKKTDFFQNEFPCETVRLGMVGSRSIDDIFPHTILNNMALINQYFDKRTVMRKYWRVFFSPKYGKANINNLLMLPYDSFSAFFDYHLPTSHLKSTFYNIWDLEKVVLEECSSHKFRHIEDVTHWLMKCWRACEGTIVPRSNKWGKHFNIGQDPNMVKAITNQIYKVICLNDCDPNVNFEEEQARLIEAFESILPEKCSFEL